MTSYIKWPGCFNLLPGLFVLLAGVSSGVLTSADLMAADDVTARAMKLYEKHYFEDAARLLHPALPAIDSSRRASASLLLGMIHLGSARLYRELHRTATGIELDYLILLSKQKTGAASHYVNLYLGQVLVEAGNPEQGIVFLKRFSENSTQALTKGIAGIELGIAYSRHKQAQSAEQVWATVDTSKPEIKAAMAGAYALAGKQENRPANLADAAVKEFKAAGKTPNMRMVRNLLRAYSHGGATEKAFELISFAELNAASYVEDLGSSKTISFYDLSLLDDLARMNLDTSVKYLELAKLDDKTGITANYFLADAYLMQGNTELSLRTLNAFLAQRNLPQKYRDSAQIVLASAYSKMGRRAEANAIWQALAEKVMNEPALVGEVVLACTQAKADCEKFEKIALAAVVKGEGKKYFPLNSALGKYYLMKKNYSQAMLYMEAGRDKANKNKIEVNDPVMLAGLAEAYYRNKKFSENLEIYFELSKQYPAVRQIQEAMQGIYAMEQQSAGDVKIF